MWKRPGENNPRLSLLQAVRGHGGEGGGCLTLPAPGDSAALVRIYGGVFGFYLKSSEKPVRRTLSKMSVLGLARGTRSKLTG